MSKTELNVNQEKFALLYASDKEFFWNGVQCYIEAYNVNKETKNWYKTALAASSRLLANVKVCARINDLLESSWLNDEFVDKQLLSLITQHSEKAVKMNAIKHYNDLKARVKLKIEHSWEIKTWQLKQVSTEELMAARENLEKENWQAEDSQ